MTTVHNPNADPRTNALIGLAVGMAHGPARFIEEQEAAGQAQIVNSTVLPTKMGDRAAYEALGFTFGDPVQGDEMFTEATLPPGWTREGSDHAMWSYILDTYGRRRVSVFYKAAFYDRSAHMSLNTLCGYLSSCLYDDTDPVLDDQWATQDAILDELDKMAVREDSESEEWRGRDAKYARYVTESTEKAAKIRALAEKIRTT